MDVVKAVIHRIEKVQNATTSDLHPATAELPLNMTLTRTAEEVRNLYKSGVVYGVFEADEKTHRFQPLLRECCDNNLNDFLGFSISALRLLQSKMNAKPASAGGYVMCIYYREQGHDYLFVIMLNDRVGTAVTDDLRLRDSIHLDLSKLYVAARINISTWKEVLGAKGDVDPAILNKYISFIRGRRQVTDYFTSFIGCTEITKPKESTNQLINILNDYAREKDLSTQEKERNRRVAADYLRNCAVEEREASLEQLSSQLNEERPDDFHDFASREDRNMNSYFLVDKPTLARLSGVHYDSARLRIRMSEAYVRESVAVNDDQNTVILSDAPEELIEEIKALL